MHKKGITEEVAKKRSRKNVKVQVGPSAGAGMVLMVMATVENGGAVLVHPCAIFHLPSSHASPHFPHRGLTNIQRGIVGADLASIMAKRTAKPEVRAAARAAAITKAKTEKRDKETKKSTAKAQGGATAPKVSKQSAKGGAGTGKGGR
jgi:hypothetical protein